jgi:hypothetical protein
MKGRGLSSAGMSALLSEGRFFLLDGDRLVLGGAILPAVNDFRVGELLERLSKSAYIGLV